MKRTQSHRTQFCLSVSSLLQRSAVRSSSRTMPLQPGLVLADGEKSGRSFGCGPLAVQEVMNRDTTDSVSFVFWPRLAVRSSALGVLHAACKAAD